MGGLKNYKELDAWQLSMTLVEATYRITRFIPDRERYGLIAQMQRSSVSIPSNIAEGQARGTTRFGLWYIRVALGSLAELDTQVELARRLRFITSDDTADLDATLHRVRQLLHGMRREHQRRLGPTTAVVSLLLIILGSRLL